MKILVYNIAISYLLGTAPSVNKEMLINAPELFSIVPVQPALNKFPIWPAIVLGRVALKRVVSTKLL
jgi:hypothetical protein